ncbi:hypothetical protein AB0G05_19560 [Nonomuraea wenchangensis]
MAIRFDLTTTASMMSAIHHLAGHLGKPATITSADRDEGTHRVLVNFIGLDLDDDGKPTLFIRGSLPALVLQGWMICCADRPGETTDDSTDSALMARWTGDTVLLNLPGKALTVEEAHHLRAQLDSAIRAAGGPDHCEIG